MGACWPSVARGPRSESSLSCCSLVLVSYSPLPVAGGIASHLRRADLAPSTHHSMNGLRYHYQHSGQHGVIGLELLKQGHHPLFPTLRQLKGLDPPPVAPVHSPTEIEVGDAATPQEESGVREVPAEEEAPKLTEPTMPAMRMQPL